jgi:hypothetical protein
MLATIAIGAITVTAVVGGQLPAQAFEISTIYASDWAYTKSDEPRTSFVKLAHDVGVGRQEEAGQEKYRGRFYFTFDLARVSGKVVSQAALVLREKSASNCAAQPPLEVWRTGPIGATPTWKNPPAQLEKLGSPSLAPNYECPGFRVLNVLDAVRAAQARGDAQLTLGLRMAEGQEGGLRFGRTFDWRPALNYTANTAPAISGLQLDWQQTCGTAANPTLVMANQQTVRAIVTDADPQDPPLNGQFASWPVNQPERRKEYFGAGYNGGLIKGTIDSYPHGTAVAYAARGYDGHDYSGWTAPCFLLVDGVAPAAAPTVTSADYPQGVPSGGPGIPGTFVLDAQGDPDVTRYAVRDIWEVRWMVDAPAPGAAANFVYTPRGAGFYNGLFVSSVDAAGNYGPETRYNFEVRSTAPGVDVEMNGLGLPSVLSFSSPVAGVTHYTYRFDDGPETTVQAQAGVATAEHTFTVAGLPRLTVTSYTATGPLGTSVISVQVNDRPKVTSDGYDGTWHNARVGSPLTFTMRPRSQGVVGYQYQLNWDQEVTEVTADAQGVAVFSWTPAEGGLWQSMFRAIHADGSYSDWNYTVAIMIVDARPYIDGYPYTPWEPAGGVGVTGTFSFYEEIPGVTEFLVRFNDGTETVIPADGSNTVWVDFTPTFAGENVLTARARFDDGTISPARTWTFVVAG